MSDYLPSIVLDTVIDALADFLQPFAAASEIVRAQVNRVSMPPGDCVVLTELLGVDLAVPYAENAPASSAVAVTGRARSDIQIDFYAPSAGDQCRAVMNAFRSGWGFSAFPDTVKPLYTSDGVQAPLVSGEEQWVSRWTLTVSLQYNPIVTLPQQFAEVLAPHTVAAADITEG